MGQKELHRWHLMKMVEIGKIPFNLLPQKTVSSYFAFSPCSRDTSVPSSIVGS
jgi:hypothetical protein